MVNTTLTNEMNTCTVIVSVKVKCSNLENTRFLKVVRSFVCEIRKELNEDNADELVATTKRKQHCQRSADSLRTPEFKSAWHGMMDEIPKKSICDILPKIFRCLKEGQEMFSSRPRIQIS
ncbi:unnamed protein product [Hymenolepis diminuta]|uniref:Uncharacterized protein n=1 Tax=Hymenolepis diminuta TaxID=6216 RepID=A0A564YH33_HYMDI|nr:unnamed protein product [Hymenolepis diminuta]VUZ46259.1 unnamed protein product [Hymenolepis diminuta]